MIKYIIPVLILIISLTACTQSSDGLDLSSAIDSASSQAIEATPTPTEKPESSNTESSDTESSSTENTSTEFIREYPEGADYGIAFIGYALDSYIDMPVEDYLTEDEMNRLEWFHFEGDEYYLILPTKENAIIELSKLDINENGEQVIGDVLFSTYPNSPLLLGANISDLYSNISVKIIDSDGETVFTPHINLMDGSVAISEDGYELETLGNVTRGEVIEIKTDYIDFSMPEIWRDKYYINTWSNYVEIYYIGAEAVENNGLILSLALLDSPYDPLFPTQVLSVINTDYQDEVFLVALRPDHDAYSGELIDLTRSIHNILYSVKPNQTFNLDIQKALQADPYFTLNMTLNREDLYEKDIQHSGAEEINGEMCNLMNIVSHSEVGDLTSYAVSLQGTVYYYDLNNLIWEEYVSLG